MKFEVKHNRGVGMGHFWLHGWGIYHLMSGALMAYWWGSYDKLLFCLETC